jgi:hypothetical protein
MRKSTPKSIRPDGAVSDTDTSSTAQPQGAVDAETPAQRQNDRLPHERDESARATGGRLKENPPPSERQITRARKDVEEGRVDTDRRGVPNDVPKSS